MGLKGYRLWDMGQLHSTCRAPPRQHAVLRRRRFPHRGELYAELRNASRVVALQVEFERQTLKPVFHLIGYRLWV
jgi:hypothetical protein